MGGGRQLASVLKVSDRGRIPGGLIHSSHSFVQEPGFFLCFLLGSSQVNSPYTAERKCVLKCPRSSRDLGDPHPSERCGVPPSFSVSPWKHLLEDLMFNFLLE